MKSRAYSIRGRLIASVLLLESAAALALIATAVVHERHNEFEAFDADLRATSSSLLGAVQEDAKDTVRLDTQGLTVPPRAIFQVAEGTHVLGSAGDLPRLALAAGSIEVAMVGGVRYRFYTVRGERSIDPDENGGIHYKLRATYGRPDGHVWHEVLEAVRFIAVATCLLLGLSALMLIWLVRRLLRPVNMLAQAAENISATQLQIDIPKSADDVLELRPLTAALRRSGERVQRAFLQQKQFTSDAAHELKTDLAIVKSSLQLLTLKTRTVEEHERGEALCLDDLTRSERTVQKMLTLARLDQERIKSGDAACRIDEVVQLAIEQSRPLGELKHVTVRVSAMPPALIPIDERDALLLCSNIVINALQHSAEFTSVWVSGSLRDGSLELQVRDQGDGVDEKDAEALFDRFYRSDASRSRKTGGTGLGLSICKAICQRAGGTIVIGNHATGGAVVKVSLPAVFAGLPSADVKPSTRDFLQSM